MMARTRKGISERHKKILEYLNRRQVETGYPPSIREIGEATDISSTSVVTYYLKQLEEMGLIERDQRVSRGVRIADAARSVSAKIEELISIPVIGRIFASEPVPVPSSDFNYYDSETSVDIARSLLPSPEISKELYALEVDGDSMIDAMVNDGDIVVMQKADVASNGEMVAVWLQDRDETTLKYFYLEDGRIRLQPANPTLQAIFIDDPDSIQVQGKVIMVIRKVE